MTCRIALNIGSIVCSCVLTQKGTTLKAIIDNLLNLSNRNSYRHSLVFFCVSPRTSSVTLNADEDGGSRFVWKLVNLYHITWHHMPEGSILHSHCFEYLISHSYLNYFEAMHYFIIFLSWKIVVNTGIIRKDTSCEICKQIELIFWSINLFLFYLNICHIGKYLRED
jgi:hypothetical protein